MNQFIHSLSGHLVGLKLCSRSGGGDSPVWFRCRLGVLPDDLKPHGEMGLDPMTAETTSCSDHMTLRLQKN